jgi:Berberine and berberine like
MRSPSRLRCGAAPTPYVAHQGALDDTVLHGWHYYWKSTNLAGLADNAIAVIADHAYAASSPRSYAAMFHMGGAVARVPHDATAYAGRDVAHNIIIDAVWLPDESTEHAAAQTAWARRFLQALQPHRADSVYVNFLDADDDTSRIREAYGDHTYRRLAEVKAKYDPTTPSTTTRTSAPAEQGLAVIDAVDGGPGRLGRERRPRRREPKHHPPDWGDQTRREGRRWGKAG